MVTNFIKFVDEKNKNSVDDEFFRISLHKSFKTVARMGGQYCFIGVFKIITHFNKHAFHLSQPLAGGAIESSLTKY